MKIVRPYSAGVNCVARFHAFLVCVSNQPEESFKRYRPEGHFTGIQSNMPLTRPRYGLDFSAGTGMPEEA